MLLSLQSLLYPLTLYRGKELEFQSVFFSLRVRSKGASGGWSNTIWLPYPLIVLPVVFKEITKPARENTGKSGRCPTCGYDLRATPNRCPECGTEIQSPQIDSDAHR